MLFNLFSRRKKTGAPVTDAAHTLVEPADVVESLPAATVVAPAPAEVVEAAAEMTPVEAPVTSESVQTEPDLVDETPVVVDVVAVTPAEVAAVDAAAPSTPAIVRPPTVPELRAQAKALGLTGYSRLPKAELLRVIAEHHAK